MKQIVYDSFGAPPQVLRLVESEPAPLEPGQARAEVLRAPINPSDLLQVAGQYGVRPALPAVAGNEGLGRVTESTSPALKPGQLVLLPAGSGTWATHVTASANAYVPVPDGDLDQLSMIVVNPPTAWLLLTDFVDLKPGDWIIQSAANSAVGGYVVQLARQMQVNVVNVVRRDSAIPGLKKLGAEVVLVDGPDLAKRVRQAVNGAPIRLAIDAVAGDTFGRLADTLEIGGTLVNYGAMSMQPAQVQAGSMIFRDIRIRGFWLVHWFERAGREARQAVYSKLVQMIATGALHAPVDRHFALEDMAEAAAYTWAGQRDGKVLLKPNG